MSDKVILLNTNEIVDVNAKLLNPDNVQYGELGVNYHGGVETISTKNDESGNAEFVPYSFYEEELNKLTNETFYQSEEPIGKTGDIWIYKEPPRPLILEFTTTTANENITLPIRENVNCEVNWGDGTPIQTITIINPAHVYATPGVYEVSINGVCSKLRVCSNNLTRVISWGDDKMGLTSMDNSFSNCNKLTSIPSDEFGAFTNVTDFIYTFWNCSGLTSIPQGLLDKCPLVTNFSNVFRDCIGLTNIPNDLFDKCPLVTNFSYTFFNCLGLTSIPNGLFDKCTLVTNFNETFGNCSGLTGTVPYDSLNGIQTPTPLYDRSVGVNGYAMVTSYGECFENCIGLSDYDSIPTNWK